MQIVGKVVTLQKIAKVITWNSKKATFVDIPGDISDNPMVAPSKANGKVFIYWHSESVFILTIIQKNNSNTLSQFLVPQGTEAQLMDRKPNLHQSSVKGDHFMFQASVQLTTIKKNMSPAPSIYVDPSLLSPTHSSRSHNDEIWPWNPHASLPDPSQDKSAEFKEFNANEDNMSTHDFTNTLYLCY